MNSKFIWFIIFIVILAGFSTFEIVYADNAINHLQTTTNEIITAFEDDTLTRDDLLKKSKSLKEEWLKNETTLCYIYNHKDMLEVGKELDQIISYVKLNNMEEGEVHAKLLLFNIQMLRGIIEVNAQNII